uniref:Anaphase-promoting complex subunit 5 n=1 Tax=Clastoptera arizonana TaxID=38151 RepID=A0A1B6DT51_9HEMI
MNAPSFSVPGTSGNKCSIREHITPHKISVIILIHEYFLIRTKENEQEKTTSTEAGLVIEEQPVIVEHTQRNRIDFCLLILKLIQCPDMTYDELENLLDSGKFILVPKLLENYRQSVGYLMKRNVGAIMDLIKEIELPLTDNPPQNSSKPLINRNSPVGVFLRRVILFFHKLTFYQTISICTAFQHYVKIGLQHAPRSSIPTTLPKDADDIEIDEENSDMEITSAPDEFLPFCGFETNDKQNDEITNSEDMDIIKEEVTTYWSRKQAELFIARQALLIQNNENAALDPPVLQEKIRQLLKANPEHAEAHFLSFLNCLRVKEFTGAIESLYHFFDRNAQMNAQCTNEEKSKTYRYAALTLATLHIKFGNNKEAMAALTEAINLAHEVNDNVCLQQTQAWLYKLTDVHKDILMARSISKCSDFGLNHLTSLGTQCFAQFAGTCGGRPSLVFEVIMRSDILNCQFSMINLMSSSLVLRSALWNMYGKTDMASLYSQILLHLDTPDSDQGLTTYNGEATCQALCNVANRLTDLGEYELAFVVIEHAKVRFRNYNWWQLSEQILYFTQALHQGQWQKADLAVKQIATLDKWESLLRKGELLLANGNGIEAMKIVNPILELDENSDPSPSIKVRALLLAAEVSQSDSVTILTSAFSISNYHFLEYHMAIVAMNLAQAQLQLGLTTQALKLMNQSLLAILSSGGCYDQARALLIYAKCKISLGKISQNTEVYSEVLRLLNTVKANFYKVKAYARVKEVAYFQALICHKIGHIDERNKFALEFRQLDEQLTY